MPGGHLSRDERKATREVRRLTRDVQRAHESSRWGGSLHPAKQRYVTASLSHNSLRPLDSGHSRSVSFLGVGSSKKDAEALRLEALYTDFARLKLEKQELEGAAEVEPGTAIGVPRARSETRGGGRKRTTTEGIKLTSTRD